MKAVGKRPLGTKNHLEQRNMRKPTVDVVVVAVVVALVPDLTLVLVVVKRTPALLSAQTQLG